MNSDEPLPSEFAAQRPTAESNLPVYPPHELPPPPPPRPPQPNWFTAILWCLFFLIATQFLPAFGGVAVGVISVFVSPPPQGKFEEELIRRALMPGMLFAQLTSIAFSMLILRIVAGRDWTRQIALRRPSAAHVVLTLIAFPAVVLLANGSYALLKQVLPSLADLTGLKGLPGMEQMVEVFGSWPLPLAILIIGVGPGIGEELWCRGFLGRGLVGTHGVIVGVLFTSLLFGLIHVDPRQGTMAALMGIILHYLYQTSRSLWLPMLLHFLNNSLSVIGVKYGGELAKLDQEPEAIPLPLYYAAIALFVIVAWVLFQSRARLADSPDGQSPWQPPYPGVAYPPDGSTTFVEHPTVGLVNWLLVGVGVAVFAGACCFALI